MSHHYHPKVFIYLLWDILASNMVPIATDVASQCIVFLYLYLAVRAFGIIFILIYDLICRFSYFQLTFSSRCSLIENFLTIYQPPFAVFLLVFAHPLSLLHRLCVSCDVLPTRESIKYATNLCLSV